MFNVTNSNAIISEPKKISDFFSSSPESTSNFEYFQKKLEPQRLFLTESIDWKLRSYLNAQKTPCQITYGESTSQRVRNTA